MQRIRPRPRPTAWARERARECSRAGHVTHAFSLYSLHGPYWYQGSGISVLQGPTEELVQELVQDFISVLLGPTEELLVQELVPEE